MKDKRHVECVKADGNAQTYSFIVIGSKTATRKGEILSIHREAIDLQRRTPADLPTVK